MGRNNADFHGEPFEKSSHYDEATDTLRHNHYWREGRHPGPVKVQRGHDITSHTLGRVQFHTYVMKGPVSNITHSLEVYDKDGDMHQIPPKDVAILHLGTIYGDRNGT